MLTPFERLIAFRYLRARREEGLISVIAAFSLVGIALGVATLIVVISVMGGVREEMLKSIIGLEGHVTVSAPGGIAEYDDIMMAARVMNAESENQPRILHTLPLVEGQALLSFRGRSTGVMVKGIRAEDLPSKPLIGEKIIDGSMEAFAAGEGIMIGARIAERSGIRVGDEVTLISPEGRATPAGMMPRVKAYPVVAVFRIGMYAYDNGLVIMPFEEAQTYFLLGGEKPRASYVEITTEDANRTRGIAQDLAAELPPPLRVSTWQEANGQMVRAVMVQRNVFFLILMLIVLVASFNIITSMIMLVREKAKAVAILRTMGATSTSILKIFFAIGATIGATGTALGTALGLLIATHTNEIQAWLERVTGQKFLADELYFLSSLPARVDAREVMMVVGVALMLTFLATLYPARKAAKVNPAEALRYE